MTTVTFAFLYLPILVVLLYSFNAGGSFGDITHFTTAWYGKFFGDSEALSALKISVVIALIATCIATILGTALAIAVAKGRRRGARAVRPVLMLNIVTPELATAVALFLCFLLVGIPLSFWTVAIGHATFSIVYVTFIVRARYTDELPVLEDAARDLGCRGVSVIRHVVIPILGPAISGAALVIFLFSIDDFPTSFFLAGSGSPPISVFIYGSVRFGITPEINVIGVCLMAASVLIGIIGNRLSGRGGRAPGPGQI